THALIGWMEQSAGLPKPAALAAALTLIATLAARRYAEPTHLYTALAAPPQTLQAVSAALTRIFDDAGHPQLVRHERVGTTTALYEIIYRTPGRLYIADDLRSQANTARRQ